jgi:hypothetical protein
MRRLFAALAMASLSGCLVVHGDPNAINGDMLSKYDAARLSAGDWVEYATTHDGEREPESVLRYACVAVEPGAAWVEVSSTTVEAKYVLMLDAETGAVKRGWKALPGEKVKELWVRSIGDPRSAPEIKEGYRLEAKTEPATASFDGKELTATRMTGAVHDTTQKDEPVEESFMAMYAEGLPFPIAWSRTLQGKGPAGGMLSQTATTDSGTVETRLVRFGHDAKRTVEVK